MEEPCELEVIGVKRWWRKSRGWIADREVIVLIDCGATHNFIAVKLVEELQISTSSTRKYGVLVTGGVNVQGRGVINNVTLTLPTFQIRTSFLPLELGVADVILGVQWLDTLGEMRVNWKRQWMKVCVDERWVELQGDLSLHSEAVSLKSLWKVVEEEGEGLVVEYEGLQRQAEDVDVIMDSRWAVLLQQYASVFEEPTEPPPSRGKEHSITLKEGARPVSVRPFRYPQI